MKMNKANARHYLWGSKCDGWHLLERQDMSIIQERMPSDTSETRHFHGTSRQFFFVLSGKLNIEIEGEVVALSSQEGVEVSPSAKHRVFNQSSDDVEFLVISHPTTQGDRVNC